MYNISDDGRRRSPPTTQETASITVVKDEWLKTGTNRKEGTVDGFVMIPNHVHGNLFIKETVGVDGRPPGKRYPSGCEVLGQLAAHQQSEQTLNISATGKISIANHRSEVYDEKHLVFFDHISVAADSLQQSFSTPAPNSNTTSPNANAASNSHTGCH